MQQSVNEEAAIPLLFIFDNRRKYVEGWKNCRSSRCNTDCKVLEELYAVALSDSTNFFMAAIVWYVYW
jgi:hypothetical protein